MSFRNFSLLICSFLLLYSCNKELTVLQSECESVNRTAAYTATETYTHRPNPYSLNNMQSVYDMYDSNIKLEATDLYVRFMPKDSSQLRILYNEYDLELFDHPLDIEINEGDVYIDPNTPEGQPTWLYTTVKPNFVFPKDIQYEIIEECYIPKDGEIIATTKGAIIEVEKEAFLKLGYSVNESEPETKASYRRPSGYLTMSLSIPFEKDTTQFMCEPIRGVKVRCNVFIKIATAYTDEMGYYAMNTKFMCNPNYTIVFDNIKDFDIWGNAGPLARAQYNMGCHPNSGHYAVIGPDCNAWEWCVINNAAYDYYNMCEDTGILKPRPNLKIWTIKTESSSSAPMLPRINDYIDFNGNSGWMKFFVMMGLDNVANFLFQTLKFLMPDITIGLKNQDFRSLYNSVCHELAHASHFSKVGSEYWAKYISYIISYGAYGDGTGINAGICEVGEMWGYSMGNNMELKKTGRLLWQTEVMDWIKPWIFRALNEKNILSFKEIYDCLNPDIESLDELIDEMHRRYPTKSAEIDEVLASDNWGYDSICPTSKLN